MTLPMQEKSFGVWLVSFQEWLGGEGTATKPDSIVLNPAWLRSRENKRRRRVGGLETNSQRPKEIALWDTSEGARAEMEAFEPEKRVPGAEQVRRYATGADPA